MQGNQQYTYNMQHNYELYSQLREILKTFNNLLAKNKDKKINRNKKDKK